MILRLTCPTCNRDAYSSSVETFKPCPYCGILFSGRYGSNKRGDTRVQKEIPFVFSHDGRVVQASTINISEGGLCIKIYGRVSLHPGDILDLSVNDSNVRGRITWAFDNADAFITVLGLQMLDGKPSSLWAQNSAYGPV